MVISRGIFKFIIVNMKTFLYDLILVNTKILILFLKMPKFVNLFSVILYLFFRIAVFLVFS